MTRQKNTEDIGEKAERIKKVIQLVILIVSIVAAGSKAWFEIDQAKKRDLIADKKLETYKTATDKKIEVMKENFEQQIGEIKKKIG